MIDDINAAVGFLQNHAAVDRDRLGITGFCMGGRVVWLMAAASSAFKAAVPYYGGSIMVPWGSATQSPFELTDGINCPMMFHFGEEDGNPSPEDKVKLDVELTRLDKPHSSSPTPARDTPSWTIPESGTIRRRPRSPGPAPWSFLPAT